MKKCFKIPSKIKTKNDAKPKNSYMKVASSWSKNVLLQKIFEKVRTQRNLVRTQRELVYKHKCALNESALNEVRTQRGIAVSRNGYISNTLPYIYQNSKLNSKALYFLNFHGI